MPVTEGPGNTAVRVALPMGLRLGEGLHWDPVTRRLWGVDIQGQMVWRWDLQTEAPDTWTLDQRVGWVLPLKDDPHRMLLGLQGGVALAPANDLGRHCWVHQPFPGQPSMRLNDAKADHTGAVWAGSLNHDDESQPMGSLFRLDAQGGWRVMDEGYAVANGPAIDADQAVMLHTDSARRTIYRFDLDAEAGRIDRKRIWKVFDETQGYPDGMCFDADGCVWIAHWDGACVTRWSMNGALLMKVDLPVSRVTNVCFAGEGLDRLFVTTASAGLDAQQRRDQPWAGHVFEVLNHGARGLSGLPWGGQ